MTALFDHWHTWIQGFSGLGSVSRALQSHSACAPKLELFRQLARVSRNSSGGKRRSRNSSTALTTRKLIERSRSSAACFRRSWTGSGNRIAVVVRVFVPIPTWTGVTNDGGRHWSTAKGAGLPAGAAFGLSCPTSSDCWTSAGGPHLLHIPPTSPTGAVIVSTTNAGATWQQDELPQGVGNAQGVSCPNRNKCFALAWSQGSVVLLADQS